MGTAGVGEVGDQVQGHTYHGKNGRGGHWAPSDSCGQGAAGRPAVHLWAHTCPGLAHTDHAVTGTAAWPVSSLRPVLRRGRPSPRKEAMT